MVAGVSENDEPGRVVLRGLRCDPAEDVAKEHAQEQPAEQSHAERLDQPVDDEGDHEAPRALHDVERLADRTGLIHKGELRAVRTPGEMVGEGERVLVRSIGAAAALDGMQAEPGGRWVIEVPRTALWDTLRRLETAGHSLIEIRPTLSLETAFLNVVKGS